MNSARHWRISSSRPAERPALPTGNPTPGRSGEWRRRLICSAVCTALLLALLGQARGETLSVLQFNEKMKEWKRDQTAPPPLTYTVEGRVTLFSENGVRLKNCKAIFHSKAEIPRLASKSSNLELSGKVSYDKRTEEFTFEVVSAREVPGDVERYHELRRKLRQPSPTKLYELAQWAKARGEFYGDDELLTVSEEAFRHGFDLERKALAKDDPEALLELLDRSNRFQLSTKLRAELTHEAFHLLAAKSRQQSGPELERLAQRMAAAWRDCTTKPLSFLSADQIKSYRERPLKAYAAADSATRAKFQRLLYADLLVRIITRDLAADGSNGFEIAAQIDKDVPEHRQLAEELRDRALAAQAADVEHLPRSQMLELADRYRARQQDRQADGLIGKWLTFHLQKLDDDDAEGLLEISEDYRRLLKQRDVADRLLIDAWKRNPKATDIGERLEKAGYHFDGEHWLAAGESNRPADENLVRAIREGRVEPGMTSSHVRQSLGEPIATSRVATAGQVTEVWRYDLAGGSTHLIVRLVRRTGQAHLTVVDVADRRAP